MRILFFGDIAGKGGRKAVQKIMPEWREKYQPDFVIANVENLAHGKGVTEKTLNDLIAVGIDAFTSGNHIFQRKESMPILEDKNLTVLRPANYPPGVPGVGYKIFNIRTKKLLVINLIGRVFFRDDYDCPFREVDRILAETKKEKVNAVFMDFHKEATSEMKAMGYHLDGRVSALVGTHTHVATADERVLSKGTAYITDVGMSGIKDSVIGVQKETVVEQFLTQMPFKFDVAEEGLAEVNAVIVDIESDGKALNIERVYGEVEV